MFCPKCGSEIPGRSRFCKHCGTEISKGNALDGIKSALSSGEPRGFLQRINKKTLAAIGFGAAVIILLLVILLGGGKKEKNAEPPAAESAEMAFEETEPEEVLFGASDPAMEAAAEEDSDAAAETVEASDTMEYQTAYQETWDSMEEIIALYWEGGDEIDRMIMSLRGSTEDFYEAIDELDPEFYDYAANSVALDNADTLLEYHLIEKGVGTLFADNELGRELRDLGERAFLGMLEGLFRYGDSMRKDSDVLVATAVSGDYALMCTKGTVSSIIEKIDTDSGYNLVGPALADYREKLIPLGSDLFEEGRIAYNNGDAEASASVYERECALWGVQAALDDYEAQWNEERDAWITAFFERFGIPKETVQPSDADSYIYCVVDKDGNVYGQFLMGKASNFWIRDDGTFSYTLGEPEVDEEGDTIYRYIGYVRNRDADILYAEEGIYGIAPCGNTLRITDDNDFQFGDYSILELIRPDGSSEELLRGYDIFVRDYGLPPVPQEGVNWLSYTGEYHSNIRQISYTSLDSRASVSVVVELDTGKITDQASWDAVHPDPDQITFRPGNNVNIAIDWTYGVIRATGEVYERADPDNVVAVIETGGGIEQMFHDETNGLYWVYTKNGYYYVTDESFNRLSEPVRVERPNTFYAFTPYGVILMGEGQSVLCDAEGNEIEAFPYQWGDYWGFMAGRSANTWGELDPYKSDYDMSYNMNTLERMYLTLDSTVG